MRILIVEVFASFEEKKKVGKKRNWFLDFYEYSVSYERYLFKK